MWETNRIAVKAYAAMGLLHAGIAAALQLRAAGGFTADQIDRIDIDMPEAAYGHGGWQAERPLAPIGAQMNVMYTVAVALLDGAVLIDEFAEDRINRDDVWNLIGRARTHHHKAYDALPAQDQLTTRVTVTLKMAAPAKTVAHPRHRRPPAHRRRHRGQVPQPDPLGDRHQPARTPSRRPCSTSIHSMTSAH